MKFRQNLIYFYLFLFIFKCNALARTGLCKLDGSFMPIACDYSFPLIYVSESENGCGGTKCWCILLDNKNRIFDGELWVELVHIFNHSGNLRRKQFQSDNVISNLTLKVLPMINRFFVEPYASSPNAISKISSIKIHNTEICKFTSSIENFNFQQPIDQSSRFQFSPYDDDRTNEEYRYVSDCMSRSGYTENSIRYCPNNRQEFVIEKRFTRTRQSYWCIIINNDNYSFTPANQLHIVYSSKYRFNYYPLDAYFEHAEPGSHFHLGNRQTFIAVSEYNNQLANFHSITIDNQPICSYIGPHVTSSFGPVTPPPIRQGPTTKLFIPPNPTIVQPPQVNQREYFPSITSYMINCGNTPIKNNPLIAYGTDTELGEWPWHAAVYKLVTKNKNIFICGGTLISLKHVITAAHCVIETNKLVIPERLTVVLGLHDRSMPSVTQQSYPVFSGMPHEAYNIESSQNDIALLLLANIVQITQYVNFVCLPQPHENFEGRLGTVVGWGRDENNELLTELKQVNLPVISFTACLESNRAFFGTYLTDSNFCAGFMNKTNVCKGDSGGGLVFNSGNQWVLGGVTSVGVLSKFVNHSCDLTQYVIFTDVTKYLPWIERNS